MILTKLIVKDVIWMHELNTNCTNAIYVHISKVDISPEILYELIAVSKIFKSKWENCFFLFIYIVTELTFSTDARCRFLRHLSGFLFR